MAVTSRNARHQTACTCMRACESNSAKTHLQEGSFRSVSAGRPIRDNVQLSSKGGTSRPGIIYFL